MNSRIYLQAPDIARFKPRVLVDNKITVLFWMNPMVNIGFSGRGPRRSLISRT
jgi:hypothetical protein